jgi:hypothetical protein
MTPPTVHPTRTDASRQQWITHDEGLFRCYCRSGMDVETFISKFRSRIDGVIDSAIAAGKTLPLHLLRGGVRG